MPRSAFCSEAVNNIGKADSVLNVIFEGACAEKLAFTSLRKQVEECGADGHGTQYGPSMFHVKRDSE